MRRVATSEVGAHEWEVEESINLWADSVGEAVGQLWIVALVGIAVKLAKVSGLLDGVARAMH